MPKLGDSCVTAKMTKGKPSTVVFATQGGAQQTDGYFVIQSPDELKQWEADCLERLGLKSSANMSGSASESCSGGNSDDCDLA